MKIIPIKEGNFIADQSKNFKILEGNQDSKGIKMSIQPFLIITENDYILLDTGVGWKNNEGELIINEVLEKENVQNTQITKVLLSHLHKDHINGTLVRTDSGFESNFPNAKIYIQKRELDFAFESRGNPSFDFEILEALIQQPNIVWMDDDQGKIDNEIYYEVVGGHTPFLQVFKIIENNEIAFYGADNLPQESYLKYHVTYKSDFDGKKAMQLRIKWQKEAIENNWKILLYHDLEKSILRL
ncbi:MBL fold metallo-hydrolase [Chryseobacterium indoltheticum]|uniref:MBL fold metallo-hydrolase n=1 Tax=Chryseobacterium indoltheticum TaxID=254 RepID=A0A3G6MW15_9FLAO|nr:MBL fold metallo-hydrolase [Chryseobacterium indoltheticum]AZA59754.1 MBL fold metallo-hydrolase [Chryseobacterium indoltheticum]